MVDDEQSLRFHARSIPQNRKAAFDVLITAMKQLAIACVGVPNLKFTVKYGCMRNGLVYNDADMLTASLPALIDARSKNQINFVADNRDAVPVVNFLGIPEESLSVNVVGAVFGYAGHDNNLNDNTDIFSHPNNNNRRI